MRQRIEPVIEAARFQQAVHPREPVGRDTRRHVMLDMIIDVVRGDQQPLPPGYHRGRGVHARICIAAIGHDTMFADLAEARDHGIGEDLRDPPQPVRPPAARQREHGEQADVKGDPRPLLGDREARERLDEIAPAGAAGHVAHQLAAQRLGGDRITGDEAEIGIVGGSGMAMMRQMIGAIVLEREVDRRPREPLPDDLVGAPVGEQRVVRAIMHEDAEPELARGDDRDRGEDRQRVGPDDRDGERACDQPPVHRERPPGPQI